MDVDWLGRPQPSVILMLCPLMPPARMCVQVQLADGTWVPTQQQQQQPANNAPMATSANTGSQVTGTGQPSPYTASSTAQGASTDINGTAMYTQNSP